MSIHILLATQRSGTFSLGTMLNRHPEVCYIGEVFHTNKNLRDYDHLDGYVPDLNYFEFLRKRLILSPNYGLPGSSELNFTDYMAYLDSKKSKNDIILDIKYNSTHHFDDGWHSPCSMPNMISYIKQAGLKIIHLKRKNLLKMYVSLRLAQENNVWHVRKENQVDINKIYIDKESLLFFLNHSKKNIEFFDWCMKDYSGVLDVFYEDIYLKDGMIKADEIDLIYGFLGVDSIEVDNYRPEFIKQTSDDLLSVVENYDEVKRWLVNTAYWSML